MNRIASAILIVAAVVVLNTGMLRDAFARDVSAPAQPTRITSVAPETMSSGQSARLLGLLQVLEALRQMQASPDGPKV